MERLVPSHLKVTGRLFACCRELDGAWLHHLHTSYFVHIVSSTAFRSKPRVNASLTSIFVHNMDHLKSTVLWFRNAYTGWGKKDAGNF